MLERIVADVRGRLPEVVARRAALEEAAKARPPVRDFTGSLRGPGLSVIAEIKRASPSRGPLDLGLDPAAQARDYQQGGAAALSVLTERDHFLGCPDDLVAARAAVDLPVLRKDFTLEPVHVVEARAMGADTILLIVAILDESQLAHLLEVAAELGLAALVEVHDEAEADRALEAGARIVGVNNRDLVTFEVSLTTAERLAPRLEGVEVRIAESGILGPPDAARMAASGFDAVLVGEYLVKSGDPVAAIRGLTGAGA